MCTAPAFRSSMPMVRRIKTLSVRKNAQSLNKRWASSSQAYRTTDKTVRCLRFGSRWAVCSTLCQDTCPRRLPKAQPTPQPPLLSPRLSSLKVRDACRVATGAGACTGACDCGDGAGGSCRCLCILSNWIGADGCSLSPLACCAGGITKTRKAPSKPDKVPVTAADATTRASRSRATPDTGTRAGDTILSSAAAWVQVKMAIESEAAVCARRKRGGVEARV